MSNISVGAAQQLPGTRPEVSDRGFTGHRHNDDLGLVYMNARYYAPYIYRMISPDSIVPDPSNPQSFNRYAYTYQNPINLVDPTGHCTDHFDAGTWEYAQCEEWLYQLGELWNLYFGSADEWNEVYGNFQSMNFDSVSGVYDGWASHHSENYQYNSSDWVTDSFGRMNWNGSEPNPYSTLDEGCRVGHLCLPDAGETINSSFFIECSLWDKHCAPEGYDKNESGGPICAGLCYVSGKTSMIQLESENGEGSYSYKEKGFGVGLSVDLELSGVSFGIGGYAVVTGEETISGSHDPSANIKYGIVIGPANLSWGISIPSLPKGVYRGN